jgi:hypothetical protein
MRKGKIGFLEFCPWCCYETEDFGYAVKGRLFPMILLTRQTFLALFAPPLELGKISTSIAPWLLRCNSNKIAV